MDQQKIGKFIAALRKEQGLTQEQLAERLGVTNRSVSRWENGKTMPDLSVLQMLGKELGITVQELIEGECSGGKTKESGDGIKKIIEFSERERIRKAKISNGYFLGGLFCIVIVLLHDQYHILDFIGSEAKQDFSVGFLTGLGLVLEIAGFYFNGRSYKFTQRELEVISSTENFSKMRTAGEMLQFARKNQKAELKQYEKAFQKIEETLQPEEAVLFSMVAEEFSVNHHPGGWHIGLAVTEGRILIGSEQIRGRLFTGYEVETFQIAEVQNVRMNQKLLELTTKNSVIELKGQDLSRFLESFRQLIK